MLKLGSGEPGADHPKRGPPSVCLINNIIHFIDIGTQAIFQCLITFARNCTAFFDGFWIVILHRGICGDYLLNQLFRKSIAQPPAIFWMCFADIYAQKLNIIVIFFVKFLDTHGTLYERRSGETPKDQCDRLLPPKIR